MCVLQGKTAYLICTFFIEVEAHYLVSTLCCHISNLSGTTARNVSIYVRADIS